MLTADSTLEELNARREEIALEQAALQKEHRQLGALINAKDIDVDVLRAEHERLGNIIKTTEMAMEVTSDG